MLGLRIPVDFHHPKETFPMINEGYDRNFWAFSFKKLAQYCQEVADDNSPQLDPALRVEAKRLIGAWSESLALPEDGFEQSSRRISILSALRKRTIEILVKTGKWE
jgi:hypothetical protein